MNITKHDLRSLLIFAVFLSLVCSGCSSNRGVPHESSPKTKAQSFGDSIATGTYSNEQSVWRVSTKSVSTVDIAIPVSTPSVPGVTSPITFGSWSSTSAALLGIEQGADTDVIVSNGYAYALSAKSMPRIRTPRITAVVPSIVNAIIQHRSSQASLPYDEAIPEVRYLVANIGNKDYVFVTDIVSTPPGTPQVTFYANGANVTLTQCQYAILTDNSGTLSWSSPTTIPTLSSSPGGELGTVLSRVLSETSESFYGNNCGNIGTLLQRSPVESTKHSRDNSQSSTPLQSGVLLQTRYDAFVNEKGEYKDISDEPKTGFWNFGVYPKIDDSIASLYLDGKDSNDNYYLAFINNGYAFSVSAARKGPVRTRRITATPPSVIPPLPSDSTFTADAHLDSKVLTYTVGNVDYLFVANTRKPLEFALTHGRKITLQKHQAAEVKDGSGPDSTKLIDFPKNSGDNNNPFTALFKHVKEKTGESYYLDDNK